MPPALFVAFAMVIALIPSQSFKPLQHPGLLAQSAIYFIVCVTLSVAILRVKNWSRWVAITFSAAQLASVLYVVAVAHGSIAMGRLGLRVLFAVGNLVFDSTTSKDGVSEWLICFVW